MVHLMQKERLKSPQKSLILENQFFLVILAILAKTAIFGHFEEAHVELSRVVVQQFRVIPRVRRVLPGNVTNSTSSNGVP